MKIVLNNFRNPKFNLDINPRFNSNINPKFNLKINPKYNSKINPQFNKGINPLIRLELNPFINPLLNPMRRKTAFYRHDEFPIQLGTRNFLGPLIFSLDCQLKGYAVMIPEIYGYLVHNINDEDNFYCVPNMKGGYNIFDDRFRWCGYFVFNSEGGYNGFSLDGSWNFFMVM